MGEEVQAFLDFMRVERSASTRTLRNYSHAINAFQEWRGDEFQIDDVCVIGVRV